MVALHSLIHFTPDSLTHSLPLLLKRQCGRTPGSDRGAAIVLGFAGDADSALKQRGVVAGLGRIVALRHRSFTSYRIYYVYDNRCLLLKRQCDRTLGGGAERLRLARRELRHLEPEPHQSGQSRVSANIVSLCYTVVYLYCTYCCVRHSRAHC